MGPFITSLMLAVGVATWIFSKLQQRTGYGNSRNALIGAVFIGLVIFGTVYLTLRLFW